MRLIIWIAALAMVECAAGALPPAHPPRRAVDASKRLLRFRGGSDVDDFMSKLKTQGNVGPLRKEEIIEKLNAVPTFCIMQEDGSVISLPDQAGQEGDECCTWFLDASEAQTTLRRVIAANPDLSGLKLASHGLGDFIEMCDGWPRASSDVAPVAASDDAPVLKLKGLREVAGAIGDQLVNALKSQGLAVGNWQVAVFIAEELAQATPEGAQIAMPVFLNPNDVRDAYAQAGIPEKALANVKVLELRQLLKYMGEATPDAVNPWRATRFYSSASAMKLAHEVGGR